MNFRDRQILKIAVPSIVSNLTGPLLGLFAFALFHNAKSRFTPAVCIAAPILSYLVSYSVSRFTSYHMGYELLMLNGLLTYLGLHITKVSKS